MIPKRYSESRKVGCPMCYGIKPKICPRCEGYTRLSDWYVVERGHVLWLDLTRDEQRALEAEYKRVEREKRKAKKA